MSRKVEIFVSGCSLCDDAVELVRRLGCPSCDIETRDMRDDAVARAAQLLGVRRVPAVAVDGVLLDCCTGGIDEARLRAAGVGSPQA